MFERRQANVHRKDSDGHANPLYDLHSSEPGLPGCPTSNPTPARDEDGKEEPGRQACCGAALGYSLQVHRWYAGQLLALTFNTVCTCDFQWMRVSLWSCEKLGNSSRPIALGSQAALASILPTQHWCREAPAKKGVRTIGDPYRLGMSHSREARSFFSALTLPLTLRPASGGDKVTVCQRAGWEAASCQRRHTRAALGEQTAKGSRHFMDDAAYRGLNLGHCTLPLYRQTLAMGFLRRANMPMHSRCSGHPSSKPGSWSYK